MTVFRRDQRRFVVLGAIASAVLVLFLLSAQDHIPVPKPSSWRPYHHYEQQNLAGNVTLQKPVKTSSSTGARLAGTLRPSHAETTIPQVLRSLDSTTRVNAWSDGFTMFDTLYLKNGTFYAVTTHPQDFPPRDHIMTGALYGSIDTEPDIDASESIQYISPAQAKNILGDVATVISGVTFFIADPPQFLTHFYHFWGEIILGAWRVYATLALSTDSTALDRLPLPDRFIMPYVEHQDGWRDPAGINGPFMRLAFPRASINKADLWKDWVKMGTTMAFERSMIINRRAAHKSPLGTTFFKMIGGTAAVNAPTHFWEPVRQSLTKTLFGYIPKVSSDGKPLVAPNFKELAPSLPSPSSPEHTVELKPIVTYISRQRTSRRLLAQDHEGLVKALRALEEEGLCEVRMPVMERLTLPEQMAEIASSTIMVGVHGNGLTHQMFMPPSLRSAVFEIQPPNDYAFDYWMLAHNMGHKHYMVRNDTLTSYPPNQWHDGVNFGPDFHSANIPVHGPTVANMIRTRLTQPDNEVEP